MRMRERLFEFWLWATDWYYAWKWRNKVITAEDMEVILEMQLGVGVRINGELWTIEGLDHLLIRYFPGECLQVWNRELEVHITVPQGEALSWIKRQIATKDFC